jgi:hypothetical protein
MSFGFSSSSLFATAENHPLVSFCRSPYIRIVTGAFAGPRTWSASVIGGKRDGVSGPGVGAAAKFIQDWDVGTIGNLVTVGMDSVVAGGVALHEAIDRRSTRVTDKNSCLRMMLLLYRFLQLFEGCHP